MAAYDGPVGAQTEGHEAGGFQGVGNGGEITVG